MLARLLSPDDFGLFALALVAVTYAEKLSDLGVAQALIFFDQDPKRTDTALVVSAILSIALFGLAFVSAPVIAGFFERPQVSPMLRTLAISLILRGIGSIPDALLRRDLLFKRRLVAEFARAAGLGIVSITLAASGAGPWSFVWGYIAGDVAWNGAAWLLCRHKPGRYVAATSWQSIKELLSFGLPAAGQGFLLALVYDIDYVIVGRLLGTAPLGYYTVAFRIPLATIVPVFWALSAVAFPIFSRMRHDMPRLRSGYLRWIAVQGTFGAAAGAGLAIIAPLVVEVFFGPRWNPAIVPLQVLSVYAAFRSLTSGVFDLLKGAGRPVLAFWISLLRLGIVLPALLVGALYGIVGVAWAQAASSFVLMIAMQWIVSRVVGVRAAELLRALRPALGAAAGTLVGAMTATGLLPGPDLLRLLAAVVIGGAGGLAGTHLADHRFLPEVALLLRRPRRTQWEAVRER